MSPESESCFAASSDFGNLTELDDFPDDLFLCNGLETIAEHDFLEEPDSQGSMKSLFNTQLIDDTFEVSLRGTNGDDVESTNAFGLSLGGTDGGDEMDSMYAGCSPFTMLLTKGPSEQLELMALHTSEPSSDAGVTSSITSHQFVEEAPPLSPRALLAAKKLDCMSLEDLDLTDLNSSHSPWTFPSPQCECAGSQSQTESTRSPTSLLPPMKKSSLNRETKSLLSIDVGSPTLMQISSPLSSPSSTTTFRTLADGTLFNVSYAHDDGLRDVKELLTTSPAENLGALIKAPCPSNNLSRGIDAFASFEGSSIYSSPMMLAEASHNSSIQRSQSSHALGQLRLPGHLGYGKAEFSTCVTWKPVMVISSAPNASNVYQFTPYEAWDSTGIDRSSTTTPMRRVFSTGDLQSLNGVWNFYGGSFENTIREQGNGMKRGNCTVEERKMKLHRYRKKRTERNFSKKVKYVCRKTLADSRPRVRGRFARSDEFGDSSAHGSDLPHTYEYEEVTSRRLWSIPVTEAAYAAPNNYCIMSNKQIPQFWNVMGMSVAM